MPPTSFQLALFCSWSWWYLFSGWVKSAVGGLMPGVTGKESRAD